MKAFEIYMNGRHLLTAGIGHNVGVLHSIVEIHGGLLNFIVRGQDAVAKETVDWPVPQLKLGDEITVKVIETDQVSPELRRYAWKQKSHEAELHEGTATEKPYH